MNIINISTEFRPKSSAPHRCYNCFLGVGSSEGTCLLVFDILHLFSVNQIRSAEYSNPSSASYLHLLFQCKPTIQNTFHHVFSDWKITRQFLTTLNNIRIATIQEHRPEDTVGHPSVAFDNFWYTTIRPAEDFLKVVEVVPAVKKSPQITQTKVYSRLLFVVIDGIFSLIRELRIPWDISVCGSFQVTRKIFKAC